MILASAATAKPAVGATAHNVDGAPKKVTLAEILRKATENKANE